MPKVVDHEQYRKTMLGQCLDLFAAKGYGSITMRQIAQGLGVSTGTLYHYFPSKESIFVQLVEEMAERDIAAFFAQAPQMGSLEERVDAVLAFCRMNQDYFVKQELLWIEFYQHAQRTQVDKPDILQRVCQSVTAKLMAYLGVSDPAIVQFLFVFLDGLWVQKIYEVENQAFYCLDTQLQMLRSCLLYLISGWSVACHSTSVTNQSFESENPESQSFELQVLESKSLESKSLESESLESESLELQCCEFSSV